MIGVELLTTERRKGRTKNVMVFTPFEMAKGAVNKSNVRILLFLLWTDSLICWGCKFGVAGLRRVGGNNLLEGMFIESIWRKRDWMAFILIVPIVF